MNGGVATPKGIIIAGVNLRWKGGTNYRNEAGLTKGAPNEARVRRKCEGISQDNQMLGVMIVSALAWINEMF